MASNPQESVPRVERATNLVERAAALAASGLLALALVGEAAGDALASPLKKTTMYEVSGAEDPLSRTIDHQLSSVLSDLELLVQRKAKHAHHQRFTSDGKVLDRYFVTLVGQDMATGQNNYIQVICVREEGLKIPESCGVMYGVPDPDAIRLSYDTGQFMARGATPNTFSLEDIFKNDKQERVETYINKDGGRYTEKTRASKGANTGEWHTKPSTWEATMQSYEDFTSSAHNIVKAALAKAPKKPPTA